MRLYDAAEVSSMAMASGRSESRADG